jgi:hypothetical protein
MGALHTITHDVTACQTAVLTFGTYLTENKEELR